MFSQVRNGVSVALDKVQRLLLKDNPRMKVMQDKLGLSPN